MAPVSSTEIVCFGSFSSEFLISTFKVINNKPEKKNHSIDYLTPGFEVDLNDDDERQLQKFVPFTNL